jgi:hypothetical protein
MCLGSNATIGSSRTLYAALQVWLFVLFGVASIISTLQSAGVPLFDWLTNPFYTQLSQQVRGVRKGVGEGARWAGSQGGGGMC